MDKALNYLIIFLLGMCIGAIILSIVIDKGYKQGQIDALTGKIKYEVQLDSTWVEKKE